MELGKVLGFRKDLYFEGAVQADWFYSKEKAKKVSENFVFHGKEYYGIEEQGIGLQKRIDTISFVKELVEKLNDDRSNPLSLAIADYGTGKSHMAVTLAQIFSGSQYMSETYEKIIDNISKLDEEAGKIIRSNTSGRNFVMVLNGMRDFNLHSEILRAAKRSIDLYGLSDECLKKLNRALQTAELFFERNIDPSLELFYEAAQNKGWKYAKSEIADRIREGLMTDEVAFDIVNDVYKKINGQEIRWDEGLSASSVLEMLISEYCGMNGMFDHIIILFDEFGRYLEYASDVNSAKSGESALQQIYELTQKTQNVEGYLHVINFIQSDIKTYLQRVDQTKNISRYIGRYDESEKYYISSNLETVFANLIQRKDKNAFNDYVVKWLDSNENAYIELFDNMNRWLNTKGMWKDFSKFRKVAVEGIYPMHPISTFMLTNLSDYLQNRSSLTLISRYIEMCSEQDISEHPLVMPEQLIKGDLYTEMLSAEQEGRQKTQQCIKYDNVIKKIGDKLSENTLTILRSNLILRILRFKTKSYEDVKLALSFCSNLSMEEIEEGLKWLENEYAVLEYDDHACVLDFTEESNGAHDFKVIKKRLMANVAISKSLINTLKIKEIAGVLEPQTTNFGTIHKITTSEWLFEQELYPIEEFTIKRADDYIEEWNKSISSNSAKGRLIWLYSNKDTQLDLLSETEKVVTKFKGKPIVVMLLNDVDNHFYDTLTEYSVLDQMEDNIRKKYERHFQEDFSRVERNLKDEIDSLKKQRLRITEEGVNKVERMPLFLTSVFEEIYPEAIPFFFDNFITKNNNISNKAGGFYCSFLKMLLSDSVSEATIHNFIAEMRNRAESLFFTTSATSWMCINEQYKVIPPQEKHASKVYESIVYMINNEKEVDCSKIYDIYCKPPYGMSEDVVTLMIAVVCANLNYCLRIKHGVLKNINVWKDEVIVNNDRKIDVKAIRESTIVYVDAGAVIGKFKHLFDEIRNNKRISEVNDYEKSLNDMILVDEVPKELEAEFLLAQKTIEFGKKAKNQWSRAVSEINQKFGEAQDSTNGEIYNALVALKLIREFPIDEIFDDNGFMFDVDSKNYLRNNELQVTKFIDDKIEKYVDGMNCDSVERLIAFRNHQTKIEKMLESLDMFDYAKMVRDKKEKEVNNIDEIKSRQELREKYQKYIDESNVDKYTTYTSVFSMIKTGKELQSQLLKYGNKMGKDSTLMKEGIEKRLTLLEKTKARIDQDISDIWDDLCDVKSDEDIVDLKERIDLVLRRGILEADKKSLEELNNDLDVLIGDIKAIKESADSRNRFAMISNSICDKYDENELDFDAISIIRCVISEIEKEMDEKEENWIKRNLTLGSKSRADIHNWKEKIRFLPEILSNNTIEAVKKLDAEANEILSEGKIEDVIFYFEKLDAKEREICLRKLNELK